MTRADANELIKKSLTPEQLIEFRYQMNVTQESIDYEVKEFGDSEIEQSDYVNVLIDLVDRTADAILYEEDSLSRKHAKTDKRTYDRLLLQIGYFRPATPHEIENTYEFTARGGMRKAKFQQIDGVKVTAERSFSEFLSALV